MPNSFHVILTRFYVYYVSLYGLIPFAVPGAENSMQLINQGIDLLMFIFVAGHILSRIFATPIIRLNFDNTNTIFIGSIFFGIWFISLSAVLQTDLFSVVSYYLATFRALIFLCLVSLVSKILRDGDYSTNFVQFDLMLITLVHAVVGLLQIFSIDIGIQLVPQLNEFQSSARALAAGEAVGIFPNSADFAYLGLAVWLTIFAYRKCSIFSPFSLISALCCAFIISSAGSLTVMILAILVSLFLLNGVKYKLATYIFTATIGIIFIAVNIDAALLVVGDKADNMLLSRLGLLFITYPSFLSSNLLGALVGLTPDFVYIYESMPVVPIAINADNALRYFNDVYILSLSLSYGLLGMVVYFFLYVKGLSLLVPASSAREFKGIRRTIFVVVILASFFNQILILKTFGIILVYGILPLRNYADK